MVAIARPDAVAAVCAALAVGQSLTLAVALWLRARRDALAQRRDDLRRLRAGQPPLAAAPVSAWLGLAVGASTLVALNDVLLHLGWVALAQRLEPLSTPALLVIGPGLWFYTRALTAAAPAQRPSVRGIWPHLLPALVLGALLVVMQALEPGSQAVPAAAPAQREWIELLLLAPMALQLLAYLARVVLEVRRLTPRLQARYSNLESRRLSWLAGGALAFGGVVLLWCATWGAPLALSNALSNLLIAFAIGLLGLYGVRQGNVFEPEPEPEPEPVQTASPLDASPAAEPPPLPEARAESEPERAAAIDAVPATRAKYARATLADDRAQAIADRLQALMAEDRPHLESDLGLADLAARIGATPHQLSQVLSVQLGQTFFEFVNQHRVEAVKRTLARPQAAGRPLLEVALECGFGSKSAFNDAFKRATGLSPGEYRRRLPASASATGTVPASTPAQGSS